jgi:hypothetical protein
MMSVFADLVNFGAPEQQDFLIVVIGGVALLALLVLGLTAITLMKKTFGKHPPVDHEIARQERRMTEIEKVIPTLATKVEMDSRFNALASKNSFETGKIHEHVETVNKHLGDRITDTADSINNTIQALPGRVIEILRNTGAIGK